MAWEFVEEEENPSLGQSLAQSGKEALRHGSRTASNLATRAIGLPGDILSTVNSLTNYISDKMGGGSVPYEETIVGKAIPTTQTHRRGLEEFSEGYLSPKNKIEEFADNILEDFALLAVPGTGLSKGASAITKQSSKSLARPLAISVGSNLAGEGAEKMTGSDKSGAIAKAGTMFLASIINPSLASKQAYSLYENARSALPEGANYSASNLSKNLDKIEKGITAGRPRSSLSKAEQFVLEKSDKVRDIIKDGRVDIDKLWAQKKSLNEDLSNLYADFGKVGSKGIKNSAKKVTGSINETLSEYGKTNPKYYKALSEADEIYGTLAKSRTMEKWVAKNIKNISLLAPVVGLPGIFGLGASKFVAGGSAALAANESAKLIYKISKSPSLRKLYGNALRSAAKEDSPAFNKYYSDLNKELKNLEAEEKWEFVD